MTWWMVVGLLAVAGLLYFWINTKVSAAYDAQIADLIDAKTTAMLAELNTRDPLKDVKEPSKDSTNTTTYPGF